ncbi:IS256 family transposase, partial [Myroides odoratimimus]
LKHFLETMLESELENHLEEEKAKGIANRRNGKTTKTVRSMQSGSIELESNRDRNGTFEPKVLPKRQLIITDQLEDNVISLYAKGSSTRDIAGYIMEMYGMDISATEISRITDKVIPAMKEWRDRPLEAIYPFVFLDCMFYKVKEQGSVTSKAVYNILGVNQEGKKELIGIYLGDTEGSKFWLSVLTNLKARGVQDIIVACVDGLKGFPEAIQAVFPKTQVQLCIVHQIRTSLRFVPHKDKKAVAADLKPIYTAVSEEQGYERLLQFEEKWAKNYPLAAKGWLDNWEHLSTYFDFDPHIRKAIYTTNAIEAMHRQVRKVTKTKGAFTTEQSLLKLMFLAITEVSKKWTMPIHNWGLTMSQLYIKFGDRLQP